METKKIFSNLHDLYNKLKKEYDNRGPFKLWTITGETGVGVNVKFVRENSPSNNSYGGIYIDNDVHRYHVLDNKLYFKYLFMTAILSI